MFFLFSAKQHTFAPLLPDNLISDDLISDDLVPDDLISDDLVPDEIKPERIITPLSCKQHTSQPPDPHGVTYI